MNGDELLNQRKQYKKLLIYYRCSSTERIKELSGCKMLEKKKKKKREREKEKKSVLNTSFRDAHNSGQTY